MKDYRTKPYAEWLEATLPEVVDLDPVSIAMVIVMPDGTTGSAYYEVDNETRVKMIQTLKDDYLIDWITVNRDYIKSILDGEDEDDGEID